jgi:hypothetical protein
MTSFNFDAPAELFASRGRGSMRQPVTYQRFVSASEAIRFAMEVLAENRLGGTVIESGDVRLEAAEIRALYESPAYPLPRTVRPEGEAD